MLLRLPSLAPLAFLAASGLSAHTFASCSSALVEAGEPCGSCRRLCRAIGAPASRKAAPLGGWTVRDSQRTLANVAGPAGLERDSGGQRVSGVDVPQWAIPPEHYANCGDTRDSVL